MTEDMIATFYWCSACVKQVRRSFSGFLATMTASLLLEHKSQLSAFVHGSLSSFSSLAISTFCKTCYIIVDTADQNKSVENAASHLFTSLMTEFHIILLLSICSLEN